MLLCTASALAACGFGYQKIQIAQADADTPIGADGDMPVGSDPAVVGDVDSVGDSTVPCLSPVTLTVIGATDAGSAQVGHGLANALDGLGYADGDPNARWALSGLPTSVTFDLGASQRLCQTRFSFYNFDNGRVYRYSIDLSVDGSEWVTAVAPADSVASEWTADDLAGIDARYVRLTLHSATPETLWAGLWEVELWGDIRNDVVPPVGVMAPSSLNPFDRSTDVAISNTSIAASFAAATSLALTLEVFTGGLGGSVVAGTFKTAGTEVSYALDGPLNNSTAYSCRVYGTVTDSTGVAKAVDRSWTFTTVAVAPTGDFVLYQDFSSVSLSDGDDYFTYADGSPIDGRVRGLSVDLAESLFLCGRTMNTAAGVKGPPEYSHYSTYIVNSPDGDTGRGKVLRSFRDANGFLFFDGDDPPAGAQIRMADNHADAGTWTEMYMSMEIYTPAINPFTGAAPEIGKSRKTPLALFSERLSFEGVRMPGDPAAAPASDTDGWSARMVMAFTRGYPNQADWLPADYLYDRTKYQRTSVFKTLDEAAARGWPLDEVLLQPGNWYKATLYVRVDQAGAGNGKFRLWVGKVGGAQHLISRRNNMAYSTATRANKISGAFGLWGYGGGHISFAVSENQFTYYDNFIMTTTRPVDIPEADVLN